MSKTLEKTAEYLVDVEDRKTGAVYTGRITGKLLHDDDSGLQVFLTADERVLIYDRMQVWESDDVDHDMRELLEDVGYVFVMTALGKKPIVDL